MAKVGIAVLLLAMTCSSVIAQPFLAGQDLLPLGNLRTVDSDGPYDLSLLDQQANEVKVGIAARRDFTDRDLIEFLTNVECLEGLFDTWGVYGRGFNGDLEKGGPTPIGAKKANLTDEVRMFLEEVALNEQGHALFTRHAGSAIPCPLIDLTGGWNKWMAAAFNLSANETVESVYGKPYDPFLNDQNFVMSVLALEELGATGNKGLIGLFTNPVLANGVAGLATSATAQATVERMLLWKLRDAIIEPFNETAEQVFARISALRDSLDGPQFDDQGLTNSDARFIAVPSNYVNMIPTDVRGLTLNRSPQMNINILTLGSPDGKGVFFPEGLNGRIKTPEGFDQIADGVRDFPAPTTTTVASQQTTEQVGTIEPPITGPTPANVTDEEALTQSLEGPNANSSYLSRGYVKIPSGTPFFSTEPVISVAKAPENNTMSAMMEGARKLLRSWVH